ncbi:MAG: JAB domain-containing protein [Cyclobacteriaceae bacterium]|nr:JAB domain-containing protein [Cyclobacteriaceae bacterium]
METQFDLSNIAEVQLSYVTKVKPSERPKIQTSRDSFEILRNTWNADTMELREEMKVMLLNHGHRLLGIYKLSEGGVAGTVADPKLIFAAAIKSNSSSIILAHNHPSGNLQPSQADIQLTKRCKEIGKMLDLVVLDHIIITADAYYSFADDGML